jgi:hypothetical protein
MAEKRPIVWRACRIAVAICVGALCVLPSATAVARPSPLSQDASASRPEGPPADHGKAHQSHSEAHPNNGKRHHGHDPAHQNSGKGHQGQAKAHENNGKAHQSHDTAHQNNGEGHQGHPKTHENNGKAHQSHDTAHQNNGKGHRPRGRALAISAVAPTPDSHGRHLALGHENHVAAQPGSHGRHLGLGHESPTSDIHHRLPGSRAREPFNPHAPHSRGIGHTPQNKPHGHVPQNSGHAHAGRTATHPNQAITPQQTPQLRTFVQPTHPTHPTRRPHPQQPTRGEHHPPHHAIKKHVATPSPPRTPSFGAAIAQQITRPGSPAMVLSLIVVACLLGTAIVVLMAHRKPTKPTA